MFLRTFNNIPLRYTSLIRLTGLCLLSFLQQGLHPLLAQSCPFHPDHDYPVAALQTDLLFLQNKLTKVHPALYRYTSRHALDHFFDSLSHSLTHPMTAQAYLSRLSLLHAKIKDGHTMLLPGTAATTWNQQYGKYFPFAVRYLAGKLYITENYSRNSTITPGTEILSIDNIPVATIMQTLFARQIRDGYNETYPAWILHHYFAAYYRFTFGQTPLFQITLKSSAGVEATQQIAALTKDSIAAFRQLRYDTTTPPGIDLRILPEQQAAILGIKSFDPALLHSTYGQPYYRTIDSLFLRLKQQQTTHLILDLRDNQGGDFAPARYLLSYLLLHPARFLWGGKETRMITPRGHHFTGKLFVLINGGSFSATAITVATLEREQRGIFIGTETGGGKYVISGDPIMATLPHTGIHVLISTKNFRITPGANNGQGVLPTYPVELTTADILTNNDPILQKALQLITRP
ncbi:S41 family peptidase [Chitinophaga nivalis]|uniref:S41 family peptidase n=1 Tax=Chitinophaga nivalis TaxID=2991709 RepID=A0ABT3II57_9BACT|nr:S41 family peptidase [Chitinophaga nivalis]MCW3466651.1 S41 family peptidase [Chitinophaga nivalis]MCW3483658.1 S41 family peptidase [Chitinophaga nivalis]